MAITIAMYTVLCIETLLWTVKIRSPSIAGSVPRVASVASEGTALPKNGRRGESVLGRAKNTVGWRTIVWLIFVAWDISVDTFRYVYIYIHMYQQTCKYKYIYIYI